MFKLKKKNLRLIKVVITIIVVVALFCLFLQFYFSNKIGLNIYISDVYVGGKTLNEAEDIIKDKKLPEKLILVVKNQKKEIATTEIVNEVKYKDTVTRAYHFANSGNIFFDFIGRLKLLFKPTNINLDIDFNDTKLTEMLLIVSSKEGSKSIKPSVRITGGQVFVDPGKNGIEVDIESAKQKIKNNLVENQNSEIVINLVETTDALNSDQVQDLKSLAQKIVGKKIELALDFDIIVLDDKTLVSFLNPKGGIDEELIKLSITDISRRINRNPQNSVFIVEDGHVTEFTPSKDGVTVNEKELTLKITESITKLVKDNIKTYSLEIPVVKSPAKIKTGDINNLGIKSLIGKGVSHFKGSIPNRIHNVNLAQSKFKGLLIPPGEVFSFNNILGDVSSYTGYKAAYVIKDGKTVLGDGGGVCQVSTTLFRAILSAGLPIIERRPHSYRVGYYEQGFGPGLDATVFYPTTDLKFKNDTPAYLLIQPTIDNPSYTLTFEIYGTNDGRISNVSKPLITSSTAPAEDLYVDDPSLPVGTIKQIEHRAYGARVVFDYKVERNGEVLIDQKFVSNYRPWQAVYLRGTATQ